jgi:plasmid stabilization system protein ParE
MSIEWSEEAVADYDATLDYIVRDFGTTVAREFQSV